MQSTYFSPVNFIGIIASICFGLLLFAIDKEVRDTYFKNIPKDNLFNFIHYTIIGIAIFFIFFVCLRYLGDSINQLVPFSSVWLNPIQRMDELTSGLLSIVLGFITSLLTIYLKKKKRQNRSI